MKYIYIYRPIYNIALVGPSPYHYLWPLPRCIIRLHRAPTHTRAAIENSRTETATVLIRKYAGHIVSGKKIAVSIVYYMW